MTKLLEKAIAEVLELPEDTQNMAADALFMVIEHVNEESHCPSSGALRQLRFS